MSQKKVWEGRFSNKTAPEMEVFSHSVDIDKRMFSEDLKVNKAWAEGLNEIGILNDREKDKIITVLKRIEEEFAKGDFSFLPEDEDIHTAVERRLTELTGAVGGKIHTGRSRNDQVITDLLLYLKRMVSEIVFRIRELEKDIIQFAEDNRDVIMPGYTHLQPAQPILFSHYLLSLFWLLERDKKRLNLAKKECGIMPLGSGALAGSGFPVNRVTLAKTLGFDAPSQNSLDITAHRDIPTGVAFASTLLSIHLGRYAADLIIWSTSEFGFVEIDETYATGSSIMPQKKNPDSLELIRGKSASAIGYLTGFLSLCQGLPHAYNRDLQEDKRHIFAIIDIAISSLEIFTGILRTLKINSEAIANSLTSDLLATELADFLTEHGIDFRKAHEITGRIVKWVKKNEIPLNKIPLEKLKEFSPIFDDNVYQWLDFKNALKRRNLYGGTGPRAVEEQLNAAKEMLKD